MASNVFTYGTLVIPEVIEAVTGRLFPHRRAVLGGFSRYRVRGQVFPAITPDPEGSTRGVLYREVGSDSLKLLDRFEADLYHRRRVQVTVADTARAEDREVEAWAYILAPGQQAQLTGEPWDPAEFSTRHLATYLAACRAFRSATGP